MRSRHFRRLVVLCKETELSHEQRACSNHHHAECLPCREFCRDMRGVERLLSLVRAAEVPAGFSGAVMQRIRQTPHRPRRAGFLLPWWR